jgi:putative methylase
LKFTKKKHLEIAIQKFPSFSNPKIQLEQYMTPASIASDVLWNAYSLGDIEYRNILDLGCGTGIFALSSLLLGANNGLGVDIDSDAIEIAKKTAISLNVSNYKFLNMDINDLNKNLAINSLNQDNDYLFKNINTVFQNPPFGAQSRGVKHVDRPFMEVAIKLAKVIYSFHMVKSEDFAIEYFNDLGGKVTHKLYFKFPLPKIYSFHSLESKDIDVVVLRVENE